MLKKQELYINLSSHSQPFLLTYPEADLSLWHSVFCFWKTKNALLES